MSQASEVLTTQQLQAIVQLGSDLQRQGDELFARHTTEYVARLQARAGRIRMEAVCGIHDLNGAQLRALATICEACDRVIKARHNG